MVVAGVAVLLVPVSCYLCLAHQVHLLHHLIPAIAPVAYEEKLDCVEAYSHRYYHCSDSPWQTTALLAWMGGVGVSALLLDGSIV